MGSVFATCSGQRHHGADDNPGASPSPDASNKVVDNSLKVWSMSFLEPISEAEGERIEGNNTEMDIRC